MSDASGQSDDEYQSRKRHWFVEGSSLELEEQHTPIKKAKQFKTRGFGGFLLSPFHSLFGMLSGDQTRGKVNESQKVFEVSYDDDNKREDDEVVLESALHRQPEPAGPIHFLNADKPQRSSAGSDDSDVVVIRHIHKNAEVDDDTDDNDDDSLEEILVRSSVVPKQTQKKKPHTNTGNTLERSFEIQQDDNEHNVLIQIADKKQNHLLYEKSFEKQIDDDEPSVLFEKVVHSPNKQLLEARRFQNELIYLNDYPDSSDDVSVISETRSKDFSSPTPDDSVSRPITPNLSILHNYSSNNVRDFWRRSSDKKPAVMKRIPVRHHFKHSTSAEKFDYSGIQKFNKKKSLLSSRDRLLESVFACGQYNIPSVTGYTQKQRITKNHTTPASDVLARARNTIMLLGGSRTHTPSISRESSVIFDRDTSIVKCRQKTPSTSSETSTIQKFNEIISQIDNLGIRSSHRGPQRYEDHYELTKRKEDKLLEEARLREGHRAQTKGDRLEDVRKKLELQGIVIRPKVEKKKKEVDDFMDLPNSADLLIEKAWNSMLNEEEKFVTVFNIPICRKDLATLSGLHWLNDNILNVYLQLISERSKGECYPKTYAFNTFFYTTLVSKGYASVKRWTRKIDLFSYEIILVPVHLGMHWCMAVIDIAEKKIEFYDSLYNGNTIVLPVLKDYLASESMDKKKTAFDFSGWTIQQMEDIPRQQNGSDCGVFSCQFAEWASRRTVPRFTQKNMQYYRKRMVYEIVSEKLLATI